MRPIRWALCVVLAVIGVSCAGRQSAPAAAALPERPGMTPADTDGRETGGSDVRDLSDTLRILEENRTNVSTYCVGASRQPLAAVEEAIRGAAPAHYAAVEAQLLACLQAPETTPDATEFLCRTLRRVGTVRAVPVLAPLLADERFSHMACYALDHVPDAAVDEALRAALPKGRGLVKIGLINEIGERRNTANAETLVELLDDADPAVCEAAAVALGKTGGPRAAAALSEARHAPSPGLRLAAARAYLDCADALFRQGQREAAAAMFDELCAPDEPVAIRMAAFRGRVEAAGDAGASQVVEVLRGETPELLSVALRLARTLPGEAATRQFAALLPALTGENKVLLLQALADRGDTAALPAVLAAITDADDRVRSVAYETVARLGDASAVPALLEPACREQGPDAEAARDCLVRLPGSDVSAALVDALDTRDAPGCVGIIRLLAARQAADAAPALADLAGCPNPDIRLEALTALAAVGRVEDLPPLLAALRSASDRESEAAASAMVSIALRAEPGAEVAALLSDAYHAARSARTKAMLVNALCETGAAAALKVLREALEDKTPSVQDAAVRGLAECAIPEALPLLLDVAKHSPRESHRILALRGYVRALSEAPDQPLEKRLEGFATAMRLAPRPEDRKQVLSGLAKVAAPEALSMAETCLADIEVQNEAAVAVMKIAAAIAPSHFVEAESAMRRVATEVSDEKVRSDANNLLAEIRVQRIRMHTTDIAAQGTADSPDSGGAAAATDGDPKTYWEDAVIRAVWRLRVQFPEPKTVTAVSLLAYEYMIRAPKDFEILCDDAVVTEVRDAAYVDRALWLEFAPRQCTCIELRMSGVYGDYPVIREWGIFAPVSRAGVKGE